ncbi:MAG: translational GTPase TypA [Eubacteriales bacterium]|jgi:GTP-binding protein|nr:translational GTPase TypA [Lachnospiraceae bacterium]MDD5860245.1 translational GTPase TypA [Eubacteriales bacterium]MCH4063196.1 translational GTPase TypA [Lachnospiraceae bacterium]MCH4105019.1 translational GTPase TypA [Lachnospiraceae bacterium]MCI1308477.1 translational GTPase TypA [Lachnospiraceae bacterium]
MSVITREDIRNIAIIAHVDHGKTTLVDAMLRQSGAFRANQEVQERVMDSGDIERERGITILSKNTAITYKGVKINIIDTPGHADFGGEVERVLKMVNGVILLVDAFEGTMPQTKFVLKKALALNLPVICCINKIDRPEARPTEVVDETLELLMDLDASDEQLECPFLYASARDGYAVKDLNDEKKDLKPLFDTILDYIPAPTGDPDKGTQVLISTIDYNEYVGRIGIGKVDNGSIAVGQTIMRVNYHNPDIHEQTKVTKLYEFDGLNKVDVQKADIGAIVAISGIADLQIGDTICTPGDDEPIPFQKITEPTIAMNFIVNDSPLAGREGKYCTSRQIRERLMRELNTDVSLRVHDTDSTDTFRVAGRGELHLSVLIEKMRREGFEFAVSKAEVIMKKDENGKKLEPMETAYVDVPQEFSGTVISMLSERKGELQGMDTLSDGTQRLEFKIPSRGLIGFHGPFLTATKGTGVINTQFDGYGPYKGDFSYRKNGSLIAFEDGEAVTYGLFAAQERGALFIGPGTKVYAGMVIGESPKPEDVEINVCKTKHLTNTRTSSSDEALTLTPPKIMSLEQAMDFIDTDELLEVTPKSLRIRKKILDSRMRKRAGFKK